MPSRPATADQFLTLPAWKGFAPRARVRVSTSTPLSSSPSAEQVAALAFLRANDRAIASAALGRMLKEYPRLRRASNEIRDEDDDDDDDDDSVAAFERSIGIRPARGLPSIRAREDLKDVVKLIRVHVLDVAHAGIAYVGFQFDCDWDEEHGAGVLMHRRKVVAFGAADVSFIDEPARKHGGKPCVRPKDISAKRSTSKPSRGGVRAAGAR